jgi:hypothetical protein
MVRPGRKQRKKGDKMKKFVMNWLPKLAVVVVGVIVAQEVLPAYAKARAAALKTVKGA